jgi:hypothetical protein
VVESGVRYCSRLLPLGVGAAALRQLKTKANYFGLGPPFGIEFRTRGQHPLSVNENANIQTTFIVEGVDRLWSEELAKAIWAVEGRQWARWGRAGKPISKNRIARLLKQCNVYPEKIRIGDRSRRGYFLSQFAEAFERYCSVSEQRNSGDEIWTSEPFQTGTEKLMSQPENSEKTDNNGAPLGKMLPSAQPQPAVRQILVRRPGVAAVGENELTWEQWQALGSETGTDCPRIKQFLRERAAFSGSLSSPSSPSSLGGQNG